MNKLEVKEMIENLTILLCEEQEADDAIVFPCEDEILEMITGHRIVNDTEEPEVVAALEETVALKPNQPLAIVWDERNRKKWYIGFYIDTNEDGTQSRSSGASKWRRRYMGETFWQR